jgi:hypothetical protein
VARAPFIIEDPEGVLHTLGRIDDDAGSSTCWSGSPTPMDQLISVTVQLRSLIVSGGAIGSLVDRLPGLRGV